MPLPEPTEYETEDDYIGACMSAQKGEDKSQDQKLAICFSKWERRNKKESTMDNNDFRGLVESVKSVIIEQNSMEQLAKTIKQILIKNKVNFKKIAYYENGVEVALGRDYPESLFDKFWDTLESNGYSYDDYEKIINVSGDFSGPLKRV